MEFHGIPPGCHRIRPKCHVNNITSKKFHGIPWNSTWISETGNQANAKVDKKKRHIFFKYNLQIRYFNGKWALECTIWQENTKNFLGEHASRSP